MNIAVIPARGGSKRIPRKNIKLFNGRPMIAWTIEKALNSQCFDKVIVTTDDSEISAVARSAGAETPFIRPKELADDITPTVPVISHAIKCMKEKGEIYDNVCCIYPCTPTLSENDLVHALDLLINSSASYVYPVTEYMHPIQRALQRDVYGKTSFREPEHELTRTQDLPVMYHDTGLFYWGCSSSWLSNKPMHTDGISFVIPSWRTVDIDNMDDWIRAEILVEYIGKSSKSFLDND